MRHRGPDQAGTWIDSFAGLGAVRLAVLDPTPAGNQPMHRADGRYHLVFNGEVYNYRSLRRQLAAHGEQFATDSDTEVVLASCIRWGTEAFTRFNGMWSLAFYDSQEQRGFLCRDRFGIKPLFYSINGEKLRFASELRPLIALGMTDSQLDPDAVTQHLQFGYIAQPATIFRAARRLAPGHYLEFNSSASRQPSRYFNPIAAAQIDRNRAYPEAVQALRRTLADAVVARRVSDVPVGAFLSGGLDSSIIVAHLAEAVGRPIKTFSVGYADQQNYDETAYARLVADRFGTDHEELILTEGDVLESIPGILDHLGEPVGDASIIPTALVSRFARQSVTVALSGDGGDELFGGYWRYLGHRSLQAYERIPQFLRRFLIEPAMNMMSSSKSSRTADRVRQLRKLLRAGAASELPRHLAWSRILSPEAESVFRDPSTPQAGDRRALENAQGLIAGFADEDPLAGILAFDLQYQLPADMLQKVDLASMMNSLEVRVPFLDPNVVELGLSLPTVFKIDRGIRKKVLVDAYRGVLPDPVLDRAKQGFEVPIGEFFRGPLRELFQDTVTRDTVASCGIMSYDGISEVYCEHVERRGEHADLLFALLSLCWWRSRPASGAA